MLNEEDVLLFIVGFFAGLLLLSLPFTPAGQSIKGIEFLDNFSEDFEAFDDLAKVETPFSRQLSICLWIYPTWARRGKLNILPAFSSCIRVLSKVSDAQWLTS